eukprot:6314107-Prorocentrum_lima.AAC.1
MPGVWYRSFPSASFGGGWKHVMLVPVAMWLAVVVWWYGSPLSAGLVWRNLAWARGSVGTPSWSARPVVIVCAYLLGLHA